MGRDYDPVQGQWYQDLDDEVLFQVMSVDPDEELVALQYENGEVEEIDLDTWHELDLEKATQPEGWTGSAVTEEDDEEEEDDDWDEDDEDDDDWDDEDDDYDDRDDA